MSGFQPNASSTESRARVQYGTNEEVHENFVGMTVAQIRLARTDMWSIPAQAKAYQAGRELPETYVLKKGDAIEFVRRQGDKG